MRKINYKNTLTAIEMIMGYATAFDLPDDKHMIRYEDDVEKCTKEYMIDLGGWRAYREFDAYDKGLVVVHISDKRLMLLLMYAFCTTLMTGSFFSYDDASGLICNLRSDSASNDCVDAYWKYAGYGDAEDFVGILDILRNFYDDEIDEDWREYHALRNRLEYWSAGGAV